MMNLNGCVIFGPQISGLIDVEQRGYHADSVFDPHAPPVSAPADLKPLGEVTAWLCAACTSVFFPSPGDGPDPVRSGGAGSPGADRDGGGRRRAAAAGDGGGGSSAGGRPGAAA